MMDAVECPLCGLPVRFTEAGAAHAGAATCTAEGVARSADDLRRLAGILFGAPSGSAYRDISNAKRLEGTSAVVLKSVTFLRDGRPSPWFRTGDDLAVRIGYEGARAGHSYFGVYLMNEMAERMATVHSTHAAHESFPQQGTIECVIKDLAVGDGVYYVMVDYGLAPPASLGTRPQPVSLDCVPNCGKIRVRLDGFMGGVGLTSYEGAAMRSTWRDYP